MKCKKCNDGIVYNARLVKDVDLSIAVKGIHCKDCALKLENELKEKRSVETYKGNDIYCKDGNYYPYWQSMYHFNSLEQAKGRIDDSHIAVMMY